MDTLYNAKNHFFPLRNKRYSTLFNYVMKRKLIESNECYSYGWVGYPWWYGGHGWHGHGWRGW